MAKLVWDQAGERTYETGVEQAAIYVMSGTTYGSGAAWNGLTGVTESPSGAEPTALYANNKKYGELMSAEEFGGTIEAYTYPDEFAVCNGEASLAKGAVIAQQTRATFGMVYKTLIGNDTEGTNYGYKLNVVYGARVKPSEKANTTVNDSPEAQTLSWEFTTTPVAVTLPDGKIGSTSKVTIDSTDADPTKLAELEAKLYGADESEPELLLPDQIAAILGVAAG
jgi:hypothetical protein